MHCVKLLGQRLSARKFDRQVAEFQFRVAVLNGFTALGIPVTEAVGKLCPGKGEPCPSPDLCMYGCPRLVQVVVERFERVIGRCHVSGLSLRR